MSGSHLAEPGYVFDNDSVHSHEQHRCLAAAYDPDSTDRLAATGVGPGWHCLEVGAGGGSIARWLAARVAPSGSVLATDVKPHHIPPAPGLTAVRHDVVRDPLPPCRFDLIHARLVLVHIAERRAVLAKLVEALTPGGWLQLDEFDVSYGPVLLAPDDRAAALYERFLATKLAVLHSAGALGSWGQEAPAALRDAGLVDLDARPHVRAWNRDSPGLRLLAHHTRHLRDALVEHGMTDRDLAEVRALLADPGFVATSCVYYTVQGRRPR